MTIRIFADAERLGFDSWNQAIGNKILHIFFVLRVAEHHGFHPIVPVDSNLDNVFRFKNGIKVLHDREFLKSIGYAYQEQTAFNVKSPMEAVVASERQFREHSQFLENPKISGDFSIKGHFWHLGLMPSSSTINKWISLKEENIEQLLKKYPSITSENAVAVHLRDTDFRDHLKNVFPKGIMLDDDYYRRAKRKVEEKIGNDVEYHLFSDNIDRLKGIFTGSKTVVHDDSYYMDWTALFIMRKLISSNSSFAWVASLFNKDLIVQPSGGYNYYEHALGSVPYGFRLPDADIIIPN